MDDKTTLRLLGHYAPGLVPGMRKCMGERALLQDVAANPDRLLSEPCGPDLEPIDVVPHWRLAQWFVGLGPVRGVTHEWASSYADQVPGEAGNRLKRSIKIYRASKSLWAADVVLVNEFIRRLPELGLTMPGHTVRPETEVGLAAPEASASASPAICSEAVTVPAEPISADEVETPEARQDRRLSWLRARGGNFVPHGDGWRVTGAVGLLAKLVRLECGKPQATKDGVRKDLMKAVLREKERHGRVSR